jgi:phage terminase small subunit
LRAKYSPKTAAAIGIENLEKPLIQAAIQKSFTERSQRTEIDQDRTLKELGRLGFSDLRKFFNPDGSIKNITDLDDDAAAAISSIEVGEITDGKEKTVIGYTRKIKLWDKNSALEKIAKHLGMLVDRKIISGTIKLEDIVAGD